MKSKPLFNIFIFFSVILLLIFGVYHFLNRGISIAKLEFGSFAIEGFYLILDKKLNLRIETITIRQSTKSASDDDSLQDKLRFALRTIKNIKILRNLIGIVSVQQIVYDDFKGSLLLQNDIISADFPHWRLRIHLYDDVNIDSLQIHIAEFTYTPHNTSLMGLIHYDLNKQQISVDSILSLDENITIYANLTSDFRHFSLQAYSENFVSLEPFVKIANNDTATLWLHRIHGDFSLSKLSIQGKLDTLKQDLQDNLFVELHIKDGSLIYEDSLNPLVFEQANILYHKGFAQAQFIHLSYDKIPLDGSNVTLQDIWNKPKLIVQILANTPLNEKIHKILHAFHIHIPLTQKSGKVDANVSLEIPLGTGEMKVMGHFTSKDSILLLGGQEILVHDADVWLKNGIVAFENLAFGTTQTLQSDGRLSLLIDTNAKTLLGSAYLENLAIKPDSGVFVLHDSTLAILGDFSGDSMLLSLPTLQIELDLGETSTISLHNLDQLAAYSSLIRDYAASGNAQLRLHDSENIELELLLYNHNLPLRTKSGSALKPLTLLGNIQASNVELRSSGGEIALDSTNDVVNVSLRNLEVAISSNATSQGSSGKTSAVALQGENLTLDIKGRKILAQTLSLNQDKKGNLTGKITNGNSVFNIQYNGTLLSILGTRLTDKILNALLATNAFDGGVYTLLAEYQQEILKANLNILKGTVKDLVGLQNMIAFIDTIPSLLMFKTPDFDQDGYKVENGSLDVELNGDSLLVRKIELNGNSLDIVGNGRIALDSNRLDLNLTLSTFKALGTVLSSIPIVNFVIMGDDGSFTTHIHVTGTLQKPKFGLSVLQDTAQDVIQAPGNILERTLELPSQLIP